MRPEYVPSILYEDNHLLVVVKPVGILSQPDGSAAPDMLSVLKQDIKRRYGRPGNVFMGLVQRLDRGVGGVMVFARTSKAASRLCAQIRQAGMVKEYVAAVRGIPPRQGCLEHHLVKHTGRRQALVSALSVTGSRPAVLTFRRRQCVSDAALLTVVLHSGRFHQIRVQLSQAGFPLLDDAKYAAGCARTNPALWSYCLGFSHPISGQRLVFHCPPPPRLPWTAFSFCSALLRTVRLQAPDKNTGASPLTVLQVPPTCSPAQLVAAQRRLFTAGDRSLVIDYRQLSALGSRL